ncbi:MAG: hypothetical protein EA369_09620 [Bradymonadales bacterium]|nr:MAG: hypothetical protein EA369_09620 [Bradymonadales bacterium]
MVISLSACLETSELETTKNAQTEDPNYSVSQSISGLDGFYTLTLAKDQRGKTYRFEDLQGSESLSIKGPIWEGSIFCSGYKASVSYDQPQKIRFESFNRSLPTCTHPYDPEGVHDRDREVNIEFLLQALESVTYYTLTEYQLVLVGDASLFVFQKINDSPPDLGLSLVQLNNTNWKLRGIEVSHPSSDGFDWPVSFFFAAGNNILYFFGQDQFHSFSDCQVVTGFWRTSFGWGILARYESLFLYPVSIFQDDSHCSGISQDSNRLWEREIIRHVLDGEAGYVHLTESELMIQKGNYILHYDRVFMIPL